MLVLDYCCALNNVHSMTSCLCLCELCCIAGCNALSFSSLQCRPPHRYRQSACACNIVGAPSTTCVCDTSWTKWITVTFYSKHGSLWGNWVFETLFWNLVSVELQVAYTWSCHSYFWQWRQDFPALSAVCVNGLHSECVKTCTNFSELLVSMDRFQAIEFLKLYFGHGLTWVNMCCSNDV